MKKNTKTQEKGKTMTQLIDNKNTFQELEACRKLKGQLIEEATKQFPFKGEYVSHKKLGEYIELLTTLSCIYQKENELTQEITKPKSK